MKFEIRCEHCSKGFLVDEQSLGQGFPCPDCHSPISTTGVAATSGPEAAAPLASASATATATATETETATLAPPAVGQVVCPRCSLHFEPGSQESPRGAPARPTVLIVEDMAYFREIASDALKDNYEVRTAETRQQAYDILRGGGIDLMVLDLTLDGGESGIDLLRSFPEKPCSILIYTAKDESEMYGDSWDELHRLGADDIVIKGMNVGESLARKVDSLLGIEPDGEE
ncbi:MAG: response regulator [Acidobacteriota bacterium]|nr:response regulator [Acidobacteriota bacterium]MDH3784741.1 response regulator [Acidobacteriota bacterium]